MLPFSIHTCDLRKLFTMVGVVLLASAGLVWSGESGGNPKPNVEAEKCEASDATTKEKYTFPEIEKWAKAIEKSLKDKPWTKKFSIKIGTSAELEKGEQCCPGDKLPTDYYKGAIKIAGSAEAEFFAPPPFAYAGVVAIHAVTPEWVPFAGGAEIFRLYGRIQAGVFGGGKGEVGVTGSGKFGECNCITLTFGGKVDVKIGLAAQGRLFLSVAGNLVFSGEIGAEGSVTATFKLDGNMKVGNSSDCSRILCWSWEAGKVTLVGKLFLAVDGYGRFEREFTSPPIFDGWSGGNCGS